MERSINTKQHQDFINITGLVRDEVRASGIKDGIVMVFVLHTTAGITVNENADPDVITDILRTFNKVFPVDADYEHYEGNSHAHIKASLMGNSVTVAVEDGELVLGTWQAIYFCEFDGPRHRTIFVKVMQG